MGLSGYGNPHWGHVRRPSPNSLYQIKLNGSNIPPGQLICETTISDSSEADEDLCEFKGVAYETIAKIALDQSKYIYMGDTPKKELTPMEIQRQLMDLIRRDY